jgi:branched-chain amino acid transport system ATP-binding protein
VRAVESVRRSLESITAGDVVFPLAVLFFLYFFDEFDTAGFGVLAPQIKRAFGLSDRSFVLIIALNLSLVLLVAIPIGYLGDRLPRKHLVVGGAVVAGVFSLCTGLAPTVLLLVFARVGNGIGVVVNDPIHRSLLSDYYRPEARAQVFATHNNAQRWGAIAGAAITGLVGYLFGWRYAFAILIVPVLLMAWVARRLRNPIRGESDDPEAAALAAEERLVPLARGARILIGVRTLRLQYASWIAIGAGFLPLAAYYPLYLDRVWHLNSFEIGFLVAAGSGAALIAVQLAGRWTQTWFARGMGEPIKYAGWSLVGVGPFLLLVAVAPDLPIAIVGILAASFVGGIFTPPFLTTQALVSPARVRSLSFSFGLLFVVLGLWVFLFFFGGVSEHSIRNGIACLVPFWIIGGLILRAAHRTVADDTRRALATLATSAEMRTARLATGRDRNILAVRGVDVSYGPVQVLFGVNFELAEGEMVALLGTNGAGKSTLLRAICGLVPIQAGSIFFDGEDISGYDPEESFARGLVQVPGGRGIFPGLTVRENLDVAVWATRRSKANAGRALDEILDMFPNLARRVDSPAAVLSGGEQQMLTLGQAFIARPKLLMIDELSLGLAPIIVEDLLGVVRRAHAEGTSVILVEQSVNVALTVADRASFMEKGEVRFAGPTAELLHRDDILRAVFLGGAAAAEGMFA